MEKIAVNYWRLRRLVRYETGEIRQLLDNFMERAVKKFYHPNPLNFNWGETTPVQPKMESYNYGDQISDADVSTQAAHVACLSDPDWPFEKDARALEFIFRSKVMRSGDRADLPNDWQDQARACIAPFKPQQIGKIRREILDRERQILTEMVEVQSWNRKFGLLARVEAILQRSELEKVLKYETALERSIFRNLETLRLLQEARLERDSRNTRRKGTNPQQQKTIWVSILTASTLRGSE